MVPEEEIDPWKYDANVTNRAPREAGRGLRGRGRGE